jgi:hypothetical protein
MFDLDKIFSDIVYSKTVSDIFGNPVLVSIIIVAIILLIILFMFKKPESDDEEEEEDDNFWRKMVKAGIYMLVPVISIIIIHYKNLEKEMESKYENKTTERIINDTLQPIINNNEINTEQKN